MRQQTSLKANRRILENKIPNMLGFDKKIDTKEPEKKLDKRFCYIKWIRFMMKSCCAFKNINSLQKKSIEKSPLKEEILSK